ncbi:N-terminal kinase-like protein [Tetranychus urticae]|uniref:N-terminal kinase-like protein n=1 Tax=Tetranychus urticae TaxID=32264 RepID=UPI00077BC071|nr:N-terminal kinase-like protein [Tetranychus urticae]
MWSFWSRNPTKDFPYDLGDLINSHLEESIWIIQKGKKKGSGEAVTIFRFECKPGTEHLLDKAKSALKRIKTLRHPSFLTYVDSLETDKIVCIVTEPVEPLPSYLESAENFTNEQKSNAISYGLHQVAIGLGFLINDCNFNHNNLHLGSVLVNSSGVWKIGGLEYVTSNNQENQVPSITKHHHSLDKYNPPELSDSSSKSSSNKWSVDSYALGCLIWEIFNGSMSHQNDLKSPGKIPSNLVAVYKELIDSNPKRRISPLDFVQRCRAKGCYMKNPFIDSMLFIEEIQIKDQTERNRFFTHLNDALNSFPPDVCKNKMLPQLIIALEFNNTGSAFLGPLLKIGKLLNEDEYQTKIVPCVIKLFAVKDRATRAKLLQEMESFINYLQPNVVNEQIFFHVSQGFVDSNPVIREQTVKCMLHLAPKLSYSNLNEEVIKHFARLQTRDEEGGIRTNTAVCLGKIAKYLHPQTRQTVLIPSFLRSMRDPFVPARIAGILALSATQTFYSLCDTATRVMPALCHLTMDPDKSVRDQAFKALKGFISKIEKVSEDPSLAEQMEADLNASGSNVSTTLAANWASWAVSSLTSKFYRSKPTSINPSNNNQISSDKTVNQQTSRSPKLTDSDIKSPSEDSINEDGDGWDPIDEPLSSTVHKTELENKKSMDGWDNEDIWNDDEVIDKEIASANVQSPTKLENSEDNWLDAQLRPNNKADLRKPSLSSRNIQPQDVVKTELDDNQDVEKERPRRPRTNIERKTTKTKKGPMKLGAQKIT